MDPATAGRSAGQMEDYAGGSGETQVCLGGVGGSMVLAAWGTASPRYDLDGNGLVDGADLALVLAAWGSCPTG